MLPTALIGSAAALLSPLPYAAEDKNIVFQSVDALEEACTAFEHSVTTDLERFLRVSKEGDYDLAYQTWSDLLFGYFSFQLELSRTLNLSLKDTVKSSTQSQMERLGELFKKKIQDPALFATFLSNAKALEKLTPQQRLFTELILKERLESHKSPEITTALDKLSTAKKASFTYAVGEMPPLKVEAASKLKVLTANIICFPGTLPYTYGGISPWKERIDQLVAMIQKTEAHIVCLQEVWDPEAMRALVEGLKMNYAEFAYDAGDPAGTLDPNRMGYNSGLFLATQLPLEDLDFYRFPRSVPQGSNRGVIMATCRVAKERIAILNTHLQHGSTLEQREIRQEQLLLCYARLQEIVSRTFSGKSWGFLAGDLNIDAFLPEFTESGLPKLFSIPYTTPLSTLLARKTEKATCTNYFNDLILTAPDKRSEIPLSYELLDYCVQPTLAEKVDSTQELIPLYSIDAPTEALSDHQALLTTFTLSSGSAQP